MVITYDPLLGNLNTSLGTVTGHAENEKIAFEYNDDRNFPHVNVDGEVDRAQNADLSGILTVHLKATSPWVKIFHRQAQSNDKFNVSWEDFNENAVTLSGNDCWIVKAPDLSRGKEIEDLEVQVFIPKAITQ